MVKILPAIEGESLKERAERIKALNVEGSKSYPGDQHRAYAITRKKFGPRNPQNAQQFDAAYAKAQMACQPVLYK